MRGLRTGRIGLLEILVTIPGSWAATLSLRALAKVTTCLLPRRIEATLGPKFITRPGFRPGTVGAIRVPGTIGSGLGLWADRLAAARLKLLAALIEELLPPLLARAAHLFTHLSYLRQLFRGKRRAHFLKRPRLEDLTLCVHLRQFEGALADTFLIQLLREHGILHLGAQFLLALPYLPHLLTIGLHRLAQLLTLLVIQNAFKQHCSLRRPEGSLATRAIVRGPVLIWRLGPAFLAFLGFPRRLGDHGGCEAAHDEHSREFEVVD